MASFVISTVDSRIWAKEIVEFWRLHLPSTPLDRLDWMEKGNPVGAAHWLLARNQSTQEIAGMLSIIPRNFNYMQKYYKAGMLGDFMVSEKYRVFGPAIPLLKYASTHCTSLGYDFVYTIPQPELKKLLINLKFTNWGRLRHFVRPLRSKFYLEKIRMLHILIPFNRIIDYLFALGCKKKRGKFIFQEIGWSDSNLSGINFSAFTENSTMIGDFNPQFLQWRYANGYNHNYKLLGLKSSESESPLGIAVVSVSDNTLQVYELLVQKTTIYKTLFASVLGYADQNKLRAVYVRLHEMSTALQTLSHPLLIDAKDDSNVVAYGNFDKIPEVLHFFWGEKLI